MSLFPWGTFPLEIYKIFVQFYSYIILVFVLRSFLVRWTPQRTLTKENALLWPNFPSFIPKVLIFSKDFRISRFLPIFQILNQKNPIFEIRIKKNTTFWQNYQFPDIPSLKIEILTKKFLVNQDNIHLNQSCLLPFSSFCKNKILLKKKKYL